jgi:hypothetical protein
MQLSGATTPEPRRSLRDGFDLVHIGSLRYVNWLARPRGGRPSETVTPSACGSSLRVGVAPKSGRLRITPPAPTEGTVRRALSTSLSERHSTMWSRASSRRADSRHSDRRPRAVRVADARRERRGLDSNPGSHGKPDVQHLLPSCPWLVDEHYDNRG